MFGIPGKAAVTLTPTTLHYDASRIAQAEAQALAARIAHIAARIAAAAWASAVSNGSVVVTAKKDSRIGSSFRAR